MSNFLSLGKINWPFNGRNHKNRANPFNLWLNSHICIPHVRDTFAHKRCTFYILLFYLHYFPSQYLY